MIFICMASHLLCLEPSTDLCGGQWPIRFLWDLPDKPGVSYWFTSSCSSSQHWSSDTISGHHSCHFSTSKCHWGCPELSLRLWMFIPCLPAADSRMVIHARMVSLPTSLHRVSVHRRSWEQESCHYTQSNLKVKHKCHLLAVKQVATSVRRLNCRVRAFPPSLEKV